MATLPNHITDLSERVYLDRGNVWATIPNLPPLVNYPAGTEMFRQDADPAGVFLLESGLVKLEHLNEDGRVNIFGIRFPGWVLGMLSMLANLPYPVSAVAATRLSSRYLSGRHFYSLLESNPHLTLQLSKLLGRELRDQYCKSADSNSGSSQRRLEQILQLLMQFGETRGVGNERRWLPPLKHHEIAEAIAITPEHLSRLFKKMEQGGLLRRDKGWIIQPVTRTPTCSHRDSSFRPASTAKSQPLN